MEEGKTQYTCRTACCERSCTTLSDFSGSVPGLIAYFRVTRLQTLTFLHGD